jgi:hypothetical protein
MPPYHWMIRSRPRLDPTVKALVLTLVGELAVPRLFEATAIREDEDDWPSWSASPTVSLELQMLGQQPLITALRITPHDSFDRASASEQRRQAITSALLRELPLGRLVRQAMLGVAVRVTPEGELGDWVVPPQAKDAEGFWYIDALDSFATPSNEEASKARPYLRRDEFPLQFKTPPWQQDTEQLSAALHQAISSRKPRRNRITTEHLVQVAKVYRRAIDDGVPPKQAVSIEFHASESTAGRWISLARQRGILGPTLPGKKGELSDPHSDAPEIDAP